MKKVGIITYHHHYNYGTVLQAYALQKAIDRIDGFEAEIIDYRAYEEKKLSRRQLVFLRIKRLPVYVFEWRRVWKLKKYESVLKAKQPKFDDFFENVFKQSKKTFRSFSELKQYNHDYDILVTGSDQTWSPKIGFFPAFFLEFGSKNALRIAYAPSIGVSKLSEEEAKYLNIHLQPYDTISCREQLGADILNATVKEKHVQCVLDPTFLLTKDDWNEIAETPLISGDYILCYFIGHRTFYRYIALHLSKELGLPLYFIPVSWQDMGKGYDLLPDTGPKEFLGLVRNARLVLTDSFHGTAFSINYRKSFYSFTKVEGGKSALDNSRLYDILSKLHLENRLFDTASNIRFTDVDYTEVEKIIEKECKQSLCFLQDALIDKRICPVNECTGCMACESVCVHKAIKIEKDLMGFSNPVKDMEICIKCGLCEKTCPNNHQPEYHVPVSSFVASAINSDEKMTSTSGGLASVLARHILIMGGVVYGCTSYDAKHVRHIRITKEQEVGRLKGSKYVQSDMTGVMSSVKHDLNSGLQVLFIGTPCQVAGLISYLRKPYENLMTVDFVCHGVPSQQLLNDIVGYECPKINESSVKIDFRFKELNGESHYGIKLTDSDNTLVFKEEYPKSRYIAGFLGGMYYRDSCYQCHYARLERASDITLGDYWDKEGQYKRLGRNGHSMVMANTAHGQALLDAVHNLILMEPISTETLVQRNGQLNHPIKKHTAWEKFRYDYLKNGYTPLTLSLLDAEIKRVKKSIRYNSIIATVKKNNFGKIIIYMVKQIRR